MGPGMDHTDEKRWDLIMKILRACKKHGVHAGIHTGSTAYAKRVREEGYQLITLLNDSRIMAAAAKAMVDDMRGPKPANTNAKAKAPAKAKSAQSVY
jgi:4-hydroxy-2-oxoheptanedioate aldolase